MSTLLEIGITNAVLATVLAAVVYVLLRRCRNPAISHILWLLVVVKLLTPPLVNLEIAQLWDAFEESQPARGDRGKNGAPQIEPAKVAPTDADFAPRLATLGNSQQTGLNEPAAGTLPGDFVPNAGALISFEARSSLPPFDWRLWPATMWIAGSFVLLLVAFGRIRRFHRLLRDTAPAPGSVQQLAESLLARFQLGSDIDVRFTSAAMPPLLWAPGRRNLIVLPSSLVEELDERELETVLAHELAHVKRRDHLVRWIELAAMIAYWWLPTVWWVRRQLREAEEAACDAWVVAILPQQRREYGNALIHAVEMLNGRSVPLPAVASGLGEGRRLLRRIERLADAGAPRLGRRPTLLVIAAALTVLPTSLNLFHTAALGQTDGGDVPAGHRQPIPEVESNEPPKPSAAEAADADPVSDPRRAAIERGVAFLRMQQDASGTWSDLNLFHGGMTALCALALLEAGLPPMDEAVSKALAWLRENDQPEKTYVVSLVTRAYARAGLPEDRGRIKRNADWLGSVMVKGGEYEGAWGYEEGHQEGDNSNSSYAILGLEAAEAAAVEVPEGVWRDALEYWIRAQNGDGSWGYKPNVAGTGSMTASGIASLAITSSQIGEIDPEVARAASVALYRAYEWMSENYSVAGNPYPTANATTTRWHYYYLAALTGAMRSTRQVKLGVHDWQTDTMGLLLKEQRNDGSWAGDELESNSKLATALALIVLANGAEPE